jgi:Fe-Mn family superoxide dismutase
MTYPIKPLRCDPAKLEGLSEKPIVSHYENNYGGAVKRLNVISEQLAALDFAKAPVFTINGLKREELIATNSTILHELYFDGLGESGGPGGKPAEAIKRDFGGSERWAAEFISMGKAMGTARVGNC